MHSNSLEWDYTVLAKAYVKRPGYSEKALDRIIALSGLQPGATVCDVGAGAAHLTRMLAQRGFQVYAVEPNEAMRAEGVRLTQGLSAVQWSHGTGEATGMKDSAFDLVTFGSSFNVTNRRLALQETARILKPGSWFACLWNHRDLDDPLQKKIEGIIGSHIQGYQYGSRRENQAPVIAASGNFGDIQAIEAPVIHHQSVEDCWEAWRSHATLQRQAGNQWEAILSDIKGVLDKLEASSVQVPYITKGWVARLSKKTKAN